MAIKIKGVIGWDIDGYTFSDKLNRLSGDIEFEIDSPGGSVTHGISIANAIKKYDRGKCTMHVVGQCSSIALYIAMCGDELPEFEPNAICVAHNPFVSATGDYRKFRQQTEVLEKMAAIYAKPFVAKGLFSEAEIRKMMDDETWFVGEKDLLKLGTIRQNPECNGGGDIEDDETLRVATLKEAMAQVAEKIKAETPCDITELAALVKDVDVAEKQTTPPNKKEFEEKEEKQEGKTDMAEEKSYEAEVKRRDALLEFIDINQEAVIDALRTGKEVTDPTFQAKILKAQLKQQTIAAMEEDSAQSLVPEAELHAPENLENTKATPQEQAKASKEEFDKMLAEVASHLR